MQYTPLSTSLRQTSWSVLLQTRIVRESDYSPASQLFCRVKKTMTDNYHKLDLVNIDAHTKFVLKILSGNKILTLIMGHNSVKILRKMTGNNPKLDLVNDDGHTKFGQILSIRSQDIEWKRNSEVNQGP